MRYKAMFVSGLVVGFVAGARAGREHYDQLVKLGGKVAGHPAVQKATQAATTKASDLTKTAAAKAPDLAKTATARVPKLVSTAKQQAASHLPFAGKGDGEEALDEGAADTQAPYPADGNTASYNGIRAD